MSLKSWRTVGLMASFAVAASAAQVQGVLMDKQCSSKAETRVAPGPRLDGGIVVAYRHTRECALMPACQKSGYGVFTYDNRFVTFDDAGNQKALEVLNGQAAGGPPHHEPQRHGLIPRTSGTGDWLRAAG